MSRDETGSAGTTIAANIREHWGSRGSALFVSGQVGIDPRTGAVAEGIEGQSEQALRNVGAVLAAAGLAWADIVKTTIWLTDVAHFTTLEPHRDRV